jgi:hypothetical protein
LLRNAQKRDKNKKKSNETTEGERKKSRIFWMSPDGFFGVFELPLLRNAQKTP